MPDKTAENYFFRAFPRFFLASRSTNYTMKSVITLMKAEIADEDIAVLLNDIRAFDFTMVNKLTQSDLMKIANTGFQFATRGVKNQREEVRSFLLNHPSTMASDIDTIINKFRLYGQLLSEPQKEKPKVMEIKGEKKTRRKRHDEEESSEIEDVEDILEEEDEHEEDDIEYIETRHGKQIVL